MSRVLLPLLALHLSITLAAGRDLTATAATLESTQGALTLAAARDMNLLSGQDSLTLNEAAQLKSSGAFSTTTRTRRDSLDQMNALGSSLSGRAGERWGYVAGIGKGGRGRTGVGDLALMPSKFLPRWTACIRDAVLKGNVLVAG